MKRNILIIAALLLFATISAEAQNEKPRLAVFVVGMSKNDVGDFLAILVGNALGGGDKYEVITRTDAVQKKLKELREYEESGNVHDGELIEWGRQHNVSMLCLVTAIRMDEYVFAAQLTDVKSNKLTGSGDCSSQILSSAELKRIADELAAQLQKSGGASVGGADSPKSFGGKNGEIWNPDGIEMVFVEGTGYGITAIKDFYIGKYEVTQAQWKAVMGRNPSEFIGDNLPVERVSWNDAQEFVNKLNAKTKRSYRLLAENEWEFAAKGGTAGSFCTDDCSYSGSNNIDNVAWYDGNSDNHTHPVGTKLPNELGIYDMSGNVWEWCQDCYNSTCSYRVYRGGSWYGNAECCRVSCRFSSSPGSTPHFLGLRIACSVK